MQWPHSAPFSSLVKQVSRLTKLIKFQITLNKIHPFDKIQDAYKSKYKQLSNENIFMSRLLIAESVEETFHQFFPNQDPIEEATNMYTKLKTSSD